jgi:hypothetical protein
MGGVPFIETTNQPVVPVVPDSPLIQFRKNDEVRFQKPVTLLQVTATWLGITTNQVRHKLGFGYPALPHQEKLLPFFSLLPNLSLEHPTHNRQVEGGGPPRSSPYLRGPQFPPFFINFIDL